MAKKEPAAGKPPAKEAASRKGRGRPRKVGAILDLLDAELKKTVTGPDGKKHRLAGDEVLVRTLVEEVQKSKDPALIRQALLMAQKEAREEAAAQSAEQELKERRMLAAAQKYEIENEIRKQRADQRAKKEDSEAKIKQYKAEQEELKTRKMTGEYIDVSLMRYYFSFFQRGISDGFAAVKKISPDIKRLYAAGKDREAEKAIIIELGACFSAAIKGLEEEIKKDLGGENDRDSRKSK